MARREYHYVITIQCPTPSGTGVQTDTYQGLMDWDSTEQEAYYQVFYDACDNVGYPNRKTYVLFWSFKPNNLEP